MSHPSKPPAGRTVNLREFNLKYGLPSVGSESKLASPTSNAVSPDVV